MKKMVTLFAIIAMIAGFSPAAFAGSVVGSDHDLSDDGLGTTEVCKFCHIPHNPVIDQPLWNHTLTTQTFTLYSGSTTSASGISQMCLSCHDGVTNLDAFGGAAGTAGNDIDTKFVGTTALIGTNLQDDHPVMVTYPADWATTGDFNDPSGLTEAKLFASNEVECASCHNPHDQSTNGKFLIASNASSNLCRDCHNK